MDEDKLDLIESILYLAGGFVWLKDVEFKYVYCDNKWKKVFFNKPSEFNIEGHTDINLLNEFRNKYNKTHDYGELCLSTDYHSAQQKQKCRYIEGGFIGRRLFVLDVIKTPIIENNIIKGNIGLAIDRSDQITQIISEIETAKRLNLLEQLTETNYSQSPFVYWLKNSNDYKLK